MSFTSFHWKIIPVVSQVALNPGCCGVGSEVHPGNELKELSFPRSGIGLRYLSCWGDTWGFSVALCFLLRGSAQWRRKKQDQILRSHLHWICREWEKKPQKDNREEKSSPTSPTTFELFVGHVI
ncbi:hypothetical protein FCV25MIE_13899 [Fagus crenata]